MISRTIHTILLNHINIIHTTNGGKQTDGKSVAQPTLFYAEILAIITVCNISYTLD